MSIFLTLLAESRARVEAVHRPRDPEPWRELIPPRCQCEGRRRIQCQHPPEPGTRACTHHRKYLERRAQQHGRS